MARGTRALLAAAAVLLAAPAAGAAAKNLLLVTIDTLRADRLGCYDAGRGPTPAMDALAARGVLFERAFAHNPSTLPSHANILSGLTPVAHGVSENAKSKFPSDLPTLATGLAARGYATAAFVGAFPLDSRFGLDRGFDVYDDVFSRGPASGAGPRERRAAEVVGSAAAWLEGRKGPWFCWVHLWDPHAPYAPPEPFAERYRDDPYAGEVAYVDSQIAVLLGGLERRGVVASTFVVLTADHGESLGEHGEMTHGYFAYDSTLRVPLIVAGPGVRPRRVGANVGHVDILPTVFDLLGVKPRPELHGRSLTGLMRTGRAEDRALYIESLEPYFDKGCAPLRGLVRGRTKFLDTPIPEVYDLAADPGESENLAGRSDLAALRRELEGLKKKLSSPATRGGARVAGADTLERLRSLGYAAGPVAQTKASYGPEDDVKTVLPYQRRLERAVLLADAGESETALRELAALVGDKKDFTPAYIYLAQFLTARGRADEAVRALEEGVRDNPGNYALLSTLGTLLLASRRDDRAREVWEKAVAIVDFDPDAWNGLGGIRMRQGDEDGALASFERARALDATFAPAHMNIGLISLRRGDKARALRSFETFLGLMKNALTADQEDRVRDLIAKCRGPRGRPAAAATLKGGRG